jgi:hypothetical protein
VKVLGRLGQPSNGSAREDRWQSLKRSYPREVFNESSDKKAPIEKGFVLEILEVK